MNDHKADILAGRCNAEMSFSQKVWAITMRIPPGKVTTYGDLAQAMGSPGAARAVGHALGQNPYAPEIPCHRVVASGGRLTGYSGVGGTGTKRHILEEEGVGFKGENVDMKNHRMDIDALEEETSR